MFSTTFTPQGPLNLGFAVTRPQSDLKPTSAFHRSTTQCWFTPSQKGVGSLSTAMAVMRRKGEGGRHSTWTALG